MKTRRWFIYLADLNPQRGTRPGKVRPCVSIQPDHFSALPSTVIIPFTTKTVDEIEDYYPLRMRISAGIGGLLKGSDLLIDQMITVDNSSFVEELGILPDFLQEELASALKEFLDL